MAKSSMERYESYKKAYLKRQEEILSKGYVMNTKMYSYAQFEEKYWETKDAIKEEVEQGLRKKASGNIYLTMVSDQATEMSRAAYKNLVKVYKEVGADINFTKYSTWQEVRAYMPIEVSDFLTEEYDSLKKIYKDAYIAQGIIAQLYFGS